MDEFCVVRERTKCSFLLMSLLQTLQTMHLLCLYNAMNDSMVAGWGWGALMTSGRSGNRPGGMLTSPSVASRHSICVFWW